MKQWDIVEITWVDSLHDTGWKFSSARTDLDSMEQMTHKTCGYLFKKGKHAVSVVQSIKILGAEDGDRCTDNLMEIPHKAILKIRRI